MVAWPVEGAPELSTTDVDPQWFRSRSFGQDPEPSRPLSVTGVSVNPRIVSGGSSAEATIPTVIDTLSEPAEHVRLRVFVIPPDFFSDPVEIGEVRGTVTDG
jgi:hypothetical protein